MLAAWTWKRRSQERTAGSWPTSVWDSTSLLAQRVCLISLMLQTWQQVKWITCFTFAAIQDYRWENHSKIWKWVFPLHTHSCWRTHALAHTADLRLSQYTCGDAGISHQHCIIHTSTFHPQVRQINNCTSLQGRSCHAVTEVPGFSNPCTSEKDSGLLLIIFWFYRELCWPLVSERKVCKYQLSSCSYSCI